MVLSHLHEDHVGVLNALPRARVVVAEDEWRARRETVFGGFRTLYYAVSFANVPRWELVTYTDRLLPYLRRRHNDYRDTVGRIRSLLRDEPGTVLVANHDPFAHGRQVRAALADGVLDTGERLALTGAVAALYRPDGSLVPDAVPRYRSPVPGSAVGRATSELP